MPAPHTDDIRDTVIAAYIRASQEHPTGPMPRVAEETGLPRTTCRDIVRRWKEEQAEIEAEADAESEAQEEVAKKAAPDPASVIRDAAASGDPAEEIARKLGLSGEAAEKLKRLFSGKTDGKPEAWDVGGAFEVEQATEPDPDPEELVDLLCQRFQKRQASSDAKNLIPVNVRMEGPIAITHLGDPHVDDDGCNWPLLKEHIEIIRNTEGMFAGNVGDTTNNWIGRLEKKYADQDIKHKDSFLIAEWFVKQVPWLYLIRGNHDMWSGNRDPMDWIMRGSSCVDESWRARLGLTFPNGRQIRINAAHDFKGHSQWNPMHALVKRAMMGWNDHIFVAGHRHTSGYSIHQQADSGILSHLIRVSGYKAVDEYAHVGMFHKQDFGPAAVTVIDPDAESEVGLVQVFFDVAQAADWLTWIRARRAAGKSVP